MENSPSHREAVICNIPAIIKAHNDGGRRIVEVMPEQRARHNEANRKYKARNKDKIQALRKKHIEEGMNAVWQRRYYDKNVETIIAKQAARPTRKAVSAASAARVRERLKQEGKWDEHRANLRPKEAVRRALRRSLNPKPARFVYTPEERRVKLRLVNGLRAAIHRVRATKTDRTLNLLGMSIKEFMMYMEGKFESGMKWDNYGTWEIDHIRPTASFKLMDETEQRVCFHYSNMQPLWMTDNRRKAAKLNYVR